MKKKAILAALLAVGMFSSCLGPNRLFNQLHDWNKEATENKWANEGIFLVCNIVPVYAVAYLADIVVTNSIEWWDGEE